MFQMRALIKLSPWLLAAIILTICIVVSGYAIQDECVESAICTEKEVISICNDEIKLQLHTEEGKLRIVTFVKETSTVGPPKLTKKEDEIFAEWSNNLKLKIKPENGKTKRAYRMIWTAPEDDEDMTFTIGLDQYNWYGGAETSTQAWPIQTQDIKETPFIPNGQNGGVVSRYFLSSYGVAHYVDDTTPLFVTLNSTTAELRFRASFETPYRNTDGRQLELNHVIIIGEDLLDTHKFGLLDYLGFPTSLPDEDIFRNPIWSTWVSYKQVISQRQVMEFANQINLHGFPASQIEIDDNWETCYGDESFVAFKFPDPSNMTRELHAQGHNVTLWVHPFVNKNCVGTFREGDELNAFVTSGDNETAGIASWWDGDQAAVIDVTKDEGAVWWQDRLNNLRDSTGIDSFKFDAGETSYLPSDPYLNCSEELQPGCYSTAYAKFAAGFGGRIECRVGYQTQRVPAFVRMLDRQSSWGLDNGLQSVLTSTLHMGLLGYPFVLPDMIGGNGYGRIPFDELFVRWVQLNAFLPVMQFSIVPWSYNANVSEISLNMVTLHQNIVDVIIAAANQATVDGSPIVRPLWWVDPNDVTAQVVNDQFTVGDEYLVAPIVIEGTFSRDVYLPVGSWQEALNGNQIFSGPVWLRDYAVDLDQIAYFINVGN